MLTAIIVERLGVIERAELELHGGSVVLTGETGAGKTLVVSAAALLLGARADRALVRAGAHDALVQGRFVVPSEHPVIECLSSHGVPVEADDDEVEIVVSRSLSVDPKRNRVRVNGSLVPLASLADIGPMLVEVAGQNEHSRIASPAHQRALLDAYAGTSDIAARVADFVRSARAASRRAEDLAAAARDRERELDALRHESSEIERAAPRIGELEELEMVARRLERAADIMEGCERASSLIRGEDGAEERLAEAARVLRSLADKDPEFARLADRTESAGVEVGDIAAELMGSMEDLDPAALDETQARIAVLRALRRKYGDDERAVLQHATRARARIAELENAEEDPESIEQTAGTVAAEAQALAVELTSRRVAAGPSLGREIEERLRGLALPGTRFVVELVPCELYDGGAETVAFKVATNPGEEPAPLARVASGGELARIALALSLLTTAKTTRTMIFDEIDSGVGGEAAAEVGRSLAQLAGEGIQVIVVTHLPQVAAFASEHHVVSKEIDGGRAQAIVHRVEGEARVTEVTRMLAGLPESARGRDHARELLQLSSGGVPAA